MNVQYSIDEFDWIDIYTFSKGTIIQKGRRGIYKNIMPIVGKLQIRFGCYCWRNSEAVFYIGSFSKDYSNKEFTTNLMGRIHNYLQNHRINKNGRKNTNLMVFDKLNKQLTQSDMFLSYLKFNEISVNDDTISYNKYSNDSLLVKTVEQVLIDTYKRINQCDWNRI